MKGIIRQVQLKRPKKTEKPVAVPRLLIQRKRAK